MGRYPFIGGRFGERYAAEGECRCNDAARAQIPTSLAHGGEETTRLPELRDTPTWFDRRIIHLGLPGPCQQLTHWDAPASTTLAEQQERIYALGLLSAKSRLHQ